MYHKNVKKFLQETLHKIDFEPKEYNEFIVYWLSLMQNNKDEPKIAQIKK